MPTGLCGSDMKCVVFCRGEGGKGGGSQDAPEERPRLDLQPRTKPVEAPKSAGEGSAPAPAPAQGKRING